MAAVTGLICTVILNFFLGFRRDKIRRSRPRGTIHFIEDLKTKEFYLFVLLGVIALALGFVAVHLN